MDQYKKYIWWNLASEYITTDDIIFWLAKKENLQSNKDFSHYIFHDNIIQELATTILNQSYITDKSDNKNSIYINQIVTLYEKMDESIEVIDSYIIEFKKRIQTILWTSNFRSLKQLSIIQDKRKELFMLIYEFKTKSSIISNNSEWIQIQQYQQTMMIKLFQCIKDLEEYF